MTSAKRLLFLHEAGVHVCKAWQKELPLHEAVNLAAPFAGLPPPTLAHRGNMYLFRLKK